MPTPPPVVYPWPQPQFPIPFQTPVQLAPPAVKTTEKEAAAENPGSKEGEIEDDGEGAVWEAAQNILQALDLSSLLPSEKVANTTTNAVTEKRVLTTSSVTPVINSDTSLNTIGDTATDPAISICSSSNKQNILCDRDAFQRSLALLAVQLADFVGDGGSAS